MPDAPDRFSLRMAAPDDAARIATLCARVRAAQLPYLPKLHTPEEDLRFFAGDVMRSCAVWLAESGRILGFIAFRTGWVDHLYVDLGDERRGVGSALLAKAMAVQPSLQLWAFRKNTGAIDFYRRRGFTIVKETDGSGNEEREPDVLLAWRKSDQSMPEQDSGRRACIVSTANGPQAAVVGDRLERHDGWPHKEKSTQ
jgi:putative acetyltransferase